MRLEIKQDAVDQIETVLTGPVAQRRQGQRHDVQTVVQIFPESARFHVADQIAVRGGDEPHVHFQLTRPAEAAELLHLQDVQQLGLQLDRELADLVEKDRPMIGQLEEPDLALLRVGKGALLVAEQLGVEERRR